MDNDRSREGVTRRYQALMIGHGALVLLVGLISGFALTFALLGDVSLWPIPWSLDLEMPGSPRGWRATHVGCLLNGVMIIVLALGLPLLPLRATAQRWVVWPLVYTGWANTVFYLFGNVAPNRGLSGGATPFGESDLAGLIAYLPAATATFLTIAAVVVVALAAFRVARDPAAPPS